MEPPRCSLGVERMMDAIARKLSLDPGVVRQRNALKPGDTLPCGQQLRHPGAALVLQRAMEISGYQEKRLTSRRIAPGRLRGMGISLYLHGGGFTGSGEENIAGRIRLEASRKGILTIRSSSVEMGQGVSTIFCHDSGGYSGGALRKGAVRNSGYLGGAGQRVPPWPPAPP